MTAPEPVTLTWPAADGRTWSLTLPAERWRVATLARGDFALPLPADALALLAALLPHLVGEDLDALAARCHAGACALANLAALAADLDGDQGAH